MSATLHSNIIVSTDLDGTLLDHYTYDWRAASDSLNLLTQKQIPIVINTSKTFAEVKQLQTELGINAAFIVENGSGLYINKSSELAHHFNDYDNDFNRSVFGSEREKITDALVHFRDERHFKFEGYNDWQVADVVAHTGLTEEKAKLSLERQFSEPLLWHDSDEKFTLFSTLVKQQGFKIIRGGRFIHILGDSNKGKALLALKNILYPNQECSLICLGDSHNDLDMLEIADIPVFIRSPVHPFPDHQCSNEAIYTSGFGPEGWNEAIQSIFNPRRA